MSCNAICNTMCVYETTGAADEDPMMLTRRTSATIRNISRVDPGARQPSQAAVTVTRVEGSSRVALSIGSDATNLVRSYDIPLRQFLQLVAAVVTADDLASAGITAAVRLQTPTPAGTSGELTPSTPGKRDHGTDESRFRWRSTRHVTR